MKTPKNFHQLGSLSTEALHSMALFTFIKAMLLKIHNTSFSSFSITHEYVSIRASIPEVRKTTCPLLALFLQTHSVYAQLLLIQELVNGYKHCLDFFSGILIKFLEENITPKYLGELQSPLKVIKIESKQDFVFFSILSPFDILLNFHES